MPQTIVPPPLSPIIPATDQSRVLLHGISWDTYTSILNDIGDGAPRLTYDHGLLEIELPGRLHERIKALVSEMAIAAMKIAGIKYDPSGATTWRTHASLKGLEADDCYHIQHNQQVAGKTELDLAIDPPPDLAIEVEVTSPLINKLEVYRGLKVPELWRIKSDGSCEMFLLDTAGDYQPIQTSVAIPSLTSAILSHYVLLREQQSHVETLKRFDADVLNKTVD